MKDTTTIAHDGWIIDYDDSPDADTVVTVGFRTDTGTQKIEIRTSNASQANQKLRDLRQLLEALITIRGP